MSKPPTEQVPQGAKQAASGGTRASTDSARTLKLETLEPRLAPGRSTVGF